MILDTDDDWFLMMKQQYKNCMKYGGTDEFYAGSAHTLYLAFRNMGFSTSEIMEWENDNNQ